MSTTEQPSPDFQFFRNVFIILCCEIFAGLAMLGWVVLP